MKNLQGDVVQIRSIYGTVVVEYAYDAWGNVLSITGMYADTLGVNNPIRYRGYYQDFETGFYYLQSRYYDPAIRRFINADGYINANGDILGFNMYAYCGNNPIMYVDPTGEFILTALIVGAVVGTIVGGAIGGTIAYNSAKSSGLEGSDLFWKTVKGIGEGAVVGGIFGGLIGLTGGVVAAYGAGSVAGTAMITGTVTIAARSTEVIALQAKKSKNDGDSAWEIANDCLDSTFLNGAQIISPGLTKANTTSIMYLAKRTTVFRRSQINFNNYLKSPGGKLLPYGTAAYAWGQTIYSIFSDDPVVRANERGYILH